jgi:signal transduction histidine kinase
MKKAIIFLIVSILAVTVQAATMSSDTTRMSEMAKRILLVASSKEYPVEAAGLLKEANAVKNDHFRAIAYKAFASYYYILNPDSFYYFYQKLEPLLLKEKSYDDYFHTRSWYIYQLIQDQKLKEALSVINDEIRMAKSLKNQDYLDSSLQNLAHYYLSVKMEKESFTLLEKVLASMEKRKASPEKQINLIREILNYSKNDKLLLYLNKLKGFIDTMESNHIESYSSLLTYSYLRIFYDRILVRKYLFPQKKYKEAELALQDIMKTDYKRASNDMQIMNLWYDYYILIDDKKNALAMSDKMILNAKDVRKEANSLAVILKKRANLLFDMDKTKEAFMTYRQYVELHDSLNSESYNKDLATLRSQLELNQLEVENKQAELKAARSQAYVNYMLWAGVTLILVILILVNLVHYSRKETKRVNEERKREEEETKRKLAFYANMNHEIRTPLNAIDGFSQLIVEEEETETRQQYYEIIHNSNELLQRLVSEVLDVSKLEAHSMTLFYKSFDVPPLMKELESFFKMRVPEDVELILREGAPLTMVTDRNRLTQVITNLFNNAVKHTKTGSITFGYDLLGEKVKFYVQDTGEGIPADKLDAVFAQYVQLGSGTSGVGLGLTICKGIIEQMGGKIGVDSVLGKGSTFWFVVPMIQGNADVTS